MRRATSIAAKAVAGYAVGILVLAVGVVIAVLRLDRVAAAQLADIRAQEYQITLAERLRWNGNHISSAARGYIIAGGPQLYDRLLRARAEFDRTLGEIQAHGLGPEGARLVKDIERSAADYQRAQVQLPSLSQRGAAGIERWFETEIVPRERELAGALDRFVEQVEGAIGHVYDKAEADRNRLRRWIYGFLGLSILMGLGIAWYFAALLGRQSKRTEHALEVSRKQAIATRDELMSVVAHDLRNPLAAILLRASVLKQETQCEASRKQAASIENVAMRMEYLIKSMLDVAALEAGEFTVTRSHAEVDELLRETAEMFGGLASTKQITLEYQAKQPNLALRIDRDRILQVLENLIGNAIKFSPQGGRVTISAEPTDRMIEFTVADTGPGISAEHLPLVFDRFWKHPTREQSSTGMGLYIAKGIVEAHGGRIWVESEDRHGATFHFTCPADQGPPTAIPSPRGEIAAVPV